MSIIPVKSKNECAYDCISLGEVMLRFDPGEGRIKNARTFSVWEGGGEYNVSRGLRKCFGLDTAVVTALASNDIGLLIEDLIMQGGVDSKFIQWMKFDGIGKKVRNGLNFTERGFGIRGALGVADRAYTAASQLKVGDIDWEFIFGNAGVRWFHTGGIFAALSNTTAELVIEAVQMAKKYNTVISYDLNYRPSLWNDNGGLDKCREINKRIAPFIDVMLGNEEDFTKCLGFEIDGNDEKLQKLEIDGYKAMISKVVEIYPNLKAIGTTLRTVKTATFNDWSAIYCINGKFYNGLEFPQLEIMDRVGGGDSFAAGFIYGLMSADDCWTALNYGIAHAALAMTTPGDTSMASKAEVERIMNGAGARVIR